MTERKQLRAALKAATPQGTASAVFATLGVVDHDGDVMRPGALRDGAPVVVSGFAHSALTSPTAPAGRGVIRIAGNKAIADVRFFLGTAAGRDAHEVVRELGDLCQWSFGFDIVKSSYGRHEGRNVRFLDDLDAYEVSPVVRGAGIGTGTLVGSVKSTPAAPPDRAELAAIRARLLPDRAELRAIKDRLQLCAIRDEIRAKSRRYYSECRPPGPELVALAESTLRITARDLGIDPPPLRWCAPETAAEAAYADTWGRDWPSFAVDEPVRGAYEVGRGVVWVASHLEAADIVATVAHEVRHAAGGDEAEAQRYELRYRLTADAN